MFNRFLWIFFCCLFSHALAHGVENQFEDALSSHFSENPTGSRANTECEPTAIVDGNVCVITGDFIESVTDLTDRYDYANAMGQNIPYTETTDPLGRIQVIIKDALGRIEARIIRDPLGEIVHKRDFKYTLGGHVLSHPDTITRPEGTSRQSMVLWAYDSLGRLISLTEAAYTPEQKMTRYIPRI